MSRASPGSEPANREPTPSSWITAQRAALLEGSTGGLAVCQAWSDALDSWFAELFATATGGDSAGVALVAVGANGRREPAPYGDVDLVLLHAPKYDVAPVADALWYPIWDSGVRLDHSVRTARQARAEAETDWKVATGFLDARLLAGEPRLLVEVAPVVANDWRARARRVLPELVADAIARHDRHGDVAHLLEPDLKESRGGLRDVNWLRCAHRAAPDVTPADPRVDEAFAALVDVRVALQSVTRSPNNLLTLQDQDAVADRLALPDADELMAHVSAAGRRIAIAADEARARVTTWAERGPRRGRRSVPPLDRPLSAGIVLRGDEIGLADGADLAADSSLAVRAAAEAASLGVPLARSALDALEEHAPAPSDPWPRLLLDGLLSLLGAGQAAVEPFEALDQRRLIERVLPEWTSVRGRPQRNALHRFTVDRHLLETAVRAADHTRDVARPDLLLLGALLHDIGKGVRGQHHTPAGMAIVSALGPRMGLPDDDVRVLVALVEHHLLLPDVATRRDIHDARTVASAAAAVARRDVLELLSVLAIADGEATGPAAWSTWKAGLVAELSMRVAAVLAGRALPAAPSVPGREHEHLLDAQLPAVEVRDGQVTVAVPDKPGVLGLVAGVLAVRGIDVRRAAIGGARGVAVEVFDIATSSTVSPDVLAGDIGAAMAGTLDVRAALRERARSREALARPTAAHPPDARVLFDDDVSDATVVEVRAPDGVGVLARIAGALAECGLDIDRALVSTLGHEVVDSFYVDPLPKDARAQVESAVLAALSTA
ncbi:MAG TPA: [protein-PII] uridylyltransferase [Acidimicrobiales bacterium]|nr:[protein-PII] uridylyltransferase [Acidimicrobiales bacterium]